MLMIMITVDFWLIAVYWWICLFHHDHDEHDHDEHDHDGHDHDGHEEATRQHNRLTRRPPEVMECEPWRRKKEEKKKECETK